MINVVVNHVLEVIFGLFIISVFANLLLGIDVLEEISKLYNRIIYGKKSNDRNKE